MGYGPRPTSVVITRTIVGLVGTEGNYPSSTRVGLLSRIWLGFLFNPVPQTI
jgi:hypothetical protein